jgi:hypothetical protein
MIVLRQHYHFLCSRASKQHLPFRADVLVSEHIFLYRTRRGISVIQNLMAPSILLI